MNELALQCKKLFGEETEINGVAGYLNANGDFIPKEKATRALVEYATREALKENLAKSNTLHEALSNNPNITIDKVDEDGTVHITCTYPTESLII